MEQDKPRQPRVLRMAEAAQYCGQKPNSFRQYYRIWGVPFLAIGKSRVFLIDDLDAWLLTRRQA